MAVSHAPRQSSRLVIPHVLLWTNVVDPTTEAAREYVRRFQPTETYDPAVAALGQHVLVLGRAGVMREVDEALARRGCRVERYEARHDYSVARRLSDLVCCDARYPSELPEPVRLAAGAASGYSDRP